MTTVSRDSSQVNVTGSEESLERFKATGRRLQETSLTTLNYQIAAIIRARRPDGSLPIEMIFFPDTSNIIYGSKTQKDIGTEARLFGSYSAEMMISIDSITGKDLTDGVEKKLRSRIEASNASKFPEKPIRIGESFEQIVPTTMQLGGGEVELIVTTTYRLKEIKNNKGFFAVSSTSSGEMSNERVKFSTSRRGIGTAEYDIAKKMMWKIDMTSAIETTMIIGDLTVLIKSVGKNLQTIVIE
jgi:hypothetical protein